MKKILLIAIALMAMMGTAAATAPTYVVGTVYETDGTTPVAGATVTAYSDLGYSVQEGIPAVADTEGDYSILLPTLVAGNTVYVEAVSGTSSGREDGILKDYSSPLSLNLALVDVNIPEFPTIALPIAAILGLAFIFQRRREEE